MSPLEHGVLGAAEGFLFVGLWGAARSRGWRESAAIPAALALVAALRAALYWLVGS